MLFYTNSDTLDDSVFLSRELLYPRKPLWVARTQSKGRRSPAGCATRRRSATLPLQTYFFVPVMCPDPSGNTPVTLDMFVMYCLTICTHNPPMEMMVTIKSKRPQICADLCVSTCKQGSNSRNSSCVF